MNRNLILALFSLLLIGLISSCSKDNDVAPVSPIVGQWDIAVYTVAGIPTSFTSVANQNGTFTTNLGTDTYIFKSDGTFTNTFSNTNNGTSNESGTWVLANSLLTLTVTTPSPPAAYIRTYVPGSNEITTGRANITVSNVKNPVTGVTESFTYTQEIVYRKKV